jgi:hypothetical protein
MLLVLLPLLPSGSLPLLAQMRSADRVRKCLLFGVDRTYRGHHETDAFDPTADMTMPPSLEQFGRYAPSSWSLARTGAAPCPEERLGEHGGKQPADDGYGMDNEPTGHQAAALADAALFTTSAGRFWPLGPVGMQAL